MQQEYIYIRECVFQSVPEYRRIIFSLFNQFSVLKDKRVLNRQQIVIL